MSHAADTDRSLRSSRELQSDQCRVVRRSERTAYWTVAFDEAGQVAADSCDVTDVPGGKVNHVRTQAPEHAVPLVGVNLPFVRGIEGTAVLVLKMCVVTTPEVSLRDQVVHVIERRHATPDISNHVHKARSLGC